MSCILELDGFPATICTNKNILSILILILDKVEELEEKLVHVQANADQAALIKREKEIELETLERYFKSTEVELHR